MTGVFFVRHAQPDENCIDDRTRPLTEVGLKDREKVTEVLSKTPIDAFFSSPYKRSFDTILPAARLFALEICTDEGFRERQIGERGYDPNLMEMRWNDFSFHEEGGESLADVQSRNIEALNGVLRSCPGKNIVIGTHGVALSTIINYYDPSFACDGFRRIWRWMPYVVQLDFDGEAYVGREELLVVDRGY